MSEDLLKRRLRKALSDAADAAEEVADDRDLPPPGPAVYRMGMKLFDARMALLFRDPDAYGLPEDERRGWE